MEMMVSKNYKENRPAEIRNHVIMFHELFFNLIPDAEQHRKNIEERALLLVDKSGLEQYKKLQEDKFFSKFIAGDLYQSITTDSVIVDAFNYPYKAMYYGKIRIRRPSLVELRSIVSSCTLEDLPNRSEKNPHSLMMRNYEIIENNKLN
jgi:conjugative transposon TraK protein